MEALDRRGRPLRDLRISVTDRQFAVHLLHAKEHFGPDHAFLPKADILRFEHIAAVWRHAKNSAFRKYGSPEENRCPTRP